MRSIMLVAAAALVAPLAGGIALAQTATPAPAPAPAADPARQMFVVPFTRGGTSINNDQLVVLEQAVAHAQRHRNLGVVIIGVANATGSQNSQATRARGMAASVREWLTDNGVAENRTRTEAQGDAAPGAQNRVEITFVAR